MPDAVVVVPTTASGAGAPIAVEQIATTQFQLVKLVGGQAGSTQHIPGDSSLGLGVQVLNTPVVTVNTLAVGFSVQALVTGPVSVSAMPSVAISTNFITTASPSIAALGQVVWIAGGQSSATANPIWVTGTVAAGAGTTVVSVQGVTPVTTAASVSITALPVWLNPTQQVVVSGLVGQSITGSVNIVSVVTITGASIGITGPVSVSALPAISISVSAALGTIITVLGTQIVSVAGGSNYVTNPASAASGLGVYIVGLSTTALSGVTGPQVWLGQSQSVIVNTIAAGFSVQALVTGPVSISVLPAVSISVSAALGTVITILGTQIVSIAGGSNYVTNPGSAASGLGVYIVGLSTTALSGVTGPQVWLGASQSVIVNTLAAGFSVQALVTISASAVLGTIIAVSALSTIINTIPVSVSHPAFSAVIASSVPPTSIAPGVPVWVVGGQTSTGVAVQVAQSAILLTTAAPSTSATGILVWQVNPAVSVSVSVAVPLTTATPSVSATGEVVWMANSAYVDYTTATPIATATGLVVREAGLVTTQSNLSGQPIWLAPTQTMTVALGSLATMVGTTTGTSGATGPIVWLGPNQATVTVTGAISSILSRPAGQVLLSVSISSVIATSTTQFMLMTVNFDAYTSSALVSGFSVVRAPLQLTGITMIYSATSVTALSVFLAVYVTTSGVSLTSAGVIMWSTVFATFTGAAVQTALVFPWTMILPQAGVMGLAVYRSASATVTLQVAFSITAQYIN